MNILALIPARGGSKGVSKKNIRPFNGRPLIAYTIEAALSSEKINKVIVSTDSEEIAGIAKQFGAEVPFMRPDSLAKDKTPDFPVIEHVVTWGEENNYDPSIIVFLRPTNIFRTGKDIDKAIELLIDSEFDSIRAISHAPYPPYWMKRIEDNKLVPFIQTGLEETRRQDLPPVYMGNGTIEVIKKETITKKKTRFGDHIGCYHMSDASRIDIDTELDFKLAELMYPLWIKGEI